MNFVAYLKKSPFRHGGLILQVSIVIVWMAMMGLLAERTFLRPQTLRVTSAMANEGMKAGEDWWGIYWKGQKIGYARTTRQQESGKIRVQEHLWLKMAILGSPQEIEQTLDYQCASNLILDSFAFSLRSGVIQFQMSGRVEAGRDLRVKINSAGREWEQKIRLQEPPYILGQAKLYFLAHGLEKGKKYRIPVFDPSTLSLADLVAEVEGVEQMAFGGEAKELYRVREDFRGIVIRSWIDRNGESWKEESPTGLVLTWEGKEAAMHKNWGRGKVADLIALTAVPSNRLIDRPRSADFLRVRLLGPSVHDLKLGGDRQRHMGNEVIVQREGFPPLPDARRPLREEERKEALRSTPFIQSDDPEIKDKARAIVQGAENEAERVKRITEWVFKEIDKRPVVSIPSAVEVLHQKVGDCNEHAVLFTALARAAGIPAQMQAGILYHEGEFFYHAWSKAFLGSWVSVDPLLNQIPADATHIRLVEGDLDRQADLIKVIGRLKVEVVEVR